MQSPTTTGASTPTRATPTAASWPSPCASAPTRRRRFICRKLAEFFLYDEPHSTLVVAPLAAELKASNWSLEPVIRRILRSRAMYSNRSLKGKVRNHVEYALRASCGPTGVNLHPTSDVINAWRVVETRLRSRISARCTLQPPDVNGWPTGTAWLSSQGMLERMPTSSPTPIEQLDDYEHADRPPPSAGGAARAERSSSITSPAMLDVQLSGSARSPRRSST